MELGNTLVVQELVTTEDLSKAGEYQRENAGVWAMPERTPRFRKCVVG